MVRSVRAERFRGLGVVSAPMWSCRLTSQARPAANAFTRSFPIQPDTIV